MSDTNQLRQRIADELNRRPADLIGSPSLSVGYAINREINSAIRHYETQRLPWNEIREEQMASTVSGTKTYSLPLRLVRLDTLKVELSNKQFDLRPVPWEEMERKSLEKSAQGLPTEYAVYGREIRLYPVPDNAYSLVASYITRYNPTSLTGSYTANVRLGGRTLTVTTTASHNNRLNGWTTDGEELVRERAKAAVRVNYLHDEQAKLEMAGLLQGGQPFLSMLERLAFTKLVDERGNIYGLAPSVPPARTES